MTLYHGSSSNVGLRRVWNKATNVADDPTIVAHALQSNHYDKSKSQLNNTISVLNSLPNYVVSAPAVSAFNKPELSV